VECAPPYIGVSFLLFADFILFTKREVFSFQHVWGRAEKARRAPLAQFFLDIRPRCAKLNAVKVSVWTSKWFETEGRGAFEFAKALRGSDLARLEKLRSRYTPAQASAILKTLQLRRRAARRFEKADEMLFTEEGLQQASSRLVAEYRARRFAGLGTVLDLCCGIGGDTIQLARVCRKVIAVDIDPETVSIAQYNLRVHGLADKVEFRVADAGARDFLAALGPEIEAAFIDPSRRRKGRRFISLDECRPSRDIVLKVMKKIGRGAVKCAPALDFGEFPADGVSVEVISLEGECKEVVLWFGDFASGPRVSATVLPQEEHLREEVCPPAEVRPPGRFIFEPDPAVVRAHLVDELAARFGLWKIDEKIAYLSGDRPAESPLLQCRPIISWLPFSLKKLNAALASLGTGRVDIKRRGFPMSPQELRKKLKLTGSATATLYCSRHAGKHVVILGGG
jgi:SAM-dependent methyltransferase